MGTTPIEDIRARITELEKYSHPPAGVITPIMFERFVHELRSEVKTLRKRVELLEQEKTDA